MHFKLERYCMKISEAKFAGSSTRVQQKPKRHLPEVAFIGRSNVGKSSLINMLCRNSKLAMTSSTPGKTKVVNHFLINDRWYLVDLPGYGYAKVSKAERDRWGRLMENYFQSAGLISLGVLIVDARHKPTADDVTMHDYFVQTGCGVVIVANKLDKLKRSEIEPSLALIRETLSLRDDEIVVPFSAERGDGKEQLLGLLRKFCE